MWNSRFGHLIPTDDLEGRKLGIEIKEKTGLVLLIPASGKEQARVELELMLIQSRKQQLN